MTGDWSLDDALAGALHAPPAWIAVGGVRGVDNADPTASRPADPEDKGAGE